MFPGIAVLGLLLLALSYALFLRLAHSPAGALKYIESSIALRKSLAAGAGGRIAMATAAAALLAAAASAVLAPPPAAVLAALLLAVPAAALHRFSQAVATASCGRIAQAESKQPGAGRSFARTPALVLAAAALGAGALAASLWLLLARNVAGSESAGIAAAALALLYPAAAHLSARATPPAALASHPARLSGLLASLTVSASALAALFLIAPGCPRAGSPSIVAAGLVAALLVTLAVYLAAHRILARIARAANP